MLYFAFFLSVCRCVLADTTSKEGQLRGLQYIGVGYDIIKGNSLIVSCKLNVSITLFIVCITRILLR